MMLNLSNMRCGKTITMQKIYENEKKKGKTVIATTKTKKELLGAYKLYD